MCSCHDHQEDHWLSSPIGKNQLDVGATGNQCDDHPAGSPTESLECHHHYTLSECPLAERRPDKVLVVLTCMLVSWLMQ